MLLSSTLVGKKRCLSLTSEEPSIGRSTKSLRCDSAVSAEKIFSHSRFVNTTDLQKHSTNTLPALFITTMDHNNPDEESINRQSPTEALHVTNMEAAHLNAHNATHPSMDQSSDEDSGSCSSSYYDDSLSSRGSPSPEPFTTSYVDYSNKNRTEPEIDASNGMSHLDPRQHPTDMSPDSYVVKLFECFLNFTPTSRPTLELSPLSYNSTKDPFIPPITDEELSNYNVEVVAATRDEDLDTLRALHSNGRPLSCCNRYGESLMHMACRRGFLPIVNFLMKEADVAIRITDDCGRTPMHDAFWHRECQYAIVDLLLGAEPSLLLLRDKRGHTPFAYARREHWEVWKQFLWDRREHMMHAMDRDVMELFRLKI